MDLLNELASLVTDHAEMQQVIAQAKRLADPETARLISELSTQFDEQFAELQATLPGAVESFTADMRQTEQHALASQAEVQRLSAQLDAYQPPPAPQTPPTPELRTLPVDPRLADRLREELLKHHGFWDARAEGDKR